MSVSLARPDERLAHERARYLERTTDLRAAEAVDREPWEYVEEAYVRAALEEVGFAHLLDEGHLFKTRWRVVDVSDE